MKTKIGIPVGLAAVMFIGVFTMMLALGVISPSGVQGADQPVNTDNGQDVDFQVTNPSVTNTSMGPGAASGYRFQFTAPMDLTAGQDTIAVHFDKDFRDLPEVLSRNNVTVSARSTSGSATTDSSGPSNTGAYNPSSDATREVLTTAKHGLSNSASLNNVEYTFYVPDMNGDNEDAPGIASGSMVTVLVSPGAGIRNPTEAGNKGPIGVFVNDTMMDTSLRITVNLSIQLSDYDTNRNKSITVVGRGFQNATTARVYLSNSGGARQELLPVTVDSDDTFTATFEVTVPPFVRGTGNMIFAEDGNTPPFVTDPLGFEVEGLATVNPTSAAVGDEVDITLTDWPDDVAIEWSMGSGHATEAEATAMGGDCYGGPAAQSSGMWYCLSNAVTIAGVPQLVLGNPSISNGSANFRVLIGPSSPSGTSELKVTAGSENDTIKITIAGADLNASPTTVVPNQAITVTGRGFGGQATVNMANDGSEISLGGSRAFLDRSGPSGFRNFNNHEAVVVDSGGNWSATIIVPITGATTTPGTHTLDITDSSSRSGGVDLTIPQRTLTIEPAEARPGETVTMEGTGFPATNSRNKGQTTPVIMILYDGDHIGTTTPDAEGNILISFRIPLDANIPSTNRVEANYTIPNTNSVVRASTTHDVPGARIQLSADEGEPGDTLTVSGDGFKSFASVDWVRIGGLDVTPAPRPATDRNGEFSTTILVPDLSPGTNAVEISVGRGTQSGTTASANFKILDVTDSRVMMTMMAEPAAPADAFAALIAEDNLIRVYHFDKLTQNDPDTGGWSLYDTREAFMSLNSIAMVEPGEFYWLQVNNDQSGVELGSETVDLVAGWNQIRW